MPLNRNNCRVFHRRLYGGILKTCTLLKRGDDQNEGTVVSFVLFQCRRSSIARTGEPIQKDMTVDSSTMWHVPRSELIRIGIRYLSSLDRIVEDHDNANQPVPPDQYRWWQPEATTVIEEKLFENETHIACLRVDPPSNAGAFV
jgi:hypothetical protein